MRFLAVRSGLVAPLAALTVAAACFAGAAWAVVPPGLVNTANRPIQTVHAARCQKMANKGVAKYLSTWSKTYLKCVGAIASCVQTKASDPDCLTKATDGCNAKITHLSDDDLKDSGEVLEDAVTNFCGSLSPSEAFDDAGGPLFGMLATRCNFGSTPFIQNYASCLLEKTNCVAERMMLVEIPRARDLLTTAGIVGVHTVGAKSCLLDEGGAGALGDAKEGKALLGCESKAAKASISFAAKARGSFAKCADAIMACTQLKPTQKCVDAAAKKCTKASQSVDDTQAKLATAITKACEKIPLADLTNTNGGDVSNLGTLCDGVGVASVATLADYGNCLAMYERCQVEDSIDLTVPRIEEFFTAAQQPSPFNSGFCPAP
jgi:hypothetical protein